MKCLSVDPIWRTQKALLLRRTSLKQKRVKCSLALCLLNVQYFEMLAILYISQISMKLYQNKEVIVLYKNLSQRSSSWFTSMQWKTASTEESQQPVERILLIGRKWKYLQLKIVYEKTHKKYHRTGQVSQCGIFTPFPPFPFFFFFFGQMNSEILHELDLLKDCIWHYRILPFLLSKPNIKNTGIIKILRYIFKEANTSIILISKVLLYLLKSH